MASEEPGVVAGIEKGPWLREGAAVGPFLFETGAEWSYGTSAVSKPTSVSGSTEAERPQVAVAAAVRKGAGRRSGALGVARACQNPVGVSHPVS